MSETNRTHATGRIEVESYEPQPYDEVSGGPNVVEIHVREAFKGDIEAKGVVRFLQACATTARRASSGSSVSPAPSEDAKGRSCCRTWERSKGSTVNGEWFVIPASGTGELTGLRGEGGFVPELGQNAAITLDYWYE